MNYSEILQPLIKKFMPFAQERMGFSDPPRLFLRSSVKNAENPLGKTAYYDPNNSTVTIFVTNRHPKDIMRSISHELVHHAQNCRGEYENVGAMGDGYAQNDEHLREMEREAYEVGNLCFRDWEDSIKNTTYFEHLQKGEKKMSTKDWKNKEIKSLLSEAWGFRMDLTKLNEAVEEEKVEEGAFDANHYCIHHGGVNHNGKVEMAEAIQHVTPDENGHISHYDMKLSDGTILENVAAEDIQVNDASLAEEHKMAGKRDGNTAMKDRPDDEELDEQSKTDRPDRVAGRDTSGRRLDEEEEEEEIEEAAKPDYIDIDGDGDKEESMKDAAKDKKKNEELKEAIAKILRKHF